jgi:transcriptional regulator with XRE-family HTH domain
MHIDDHMSEAAILAELGHRLERHRVERNRTQADLAEEAGIGRATLQRIERGESVQLTSIVKLLRAVELLSALDAAVPETIAFPIAELERQQRRGRRRARGRHGGPTPVDEDQPWGWGDDPGATT